jgi:hypothetical protein
VTPPEEEEEEEDPKERIIVLSLMNRERGQQNQNAEETKMMKTSKTKEKA